MNGGHFRGNQRQRAASSTRTPRNSEGVDTRENSADRGTRQKQTKNVLRSKHSPNKFPDFNNEPSFSKDYGCLGYNGKIEVGGEATFTTSAVGLIDIADIIYNRLTAMSERFAKSVSHAMFGYYAMELYYMRICCIELSNGSQDLDVRMLTEHARNNRWVVPELLSDYLRCIGDFEDSTGLTARHREIMLPYDDVVDGISGYFGQVDDQSHSHYENRPAPGVAAQRICEDLFYTLTRDEDYREWNLPESLQPDGENAELPTANLLGWAPSCKLSEEQKNVLKMCGIAVTFKRDFSFANTKFCYNHDLMCLVDRRLYELAGKIRCTQVLKYGSHGSMAQQDFQVATFIETSPHKEFAVTDLYGKNGIQNCGMVKLDPRQEIWAHVSRFRLRRDGVVGDKDIHNTWCCYRFNNYDSLTHDWTETRNTYFEFGNRNSWNILRFQSASMDPRFGLNLMLDKTILDGDEFFSD